MGDWVMIPCTESRASARPAAVGLTPARRAVSRTEASPRGDRDRAASTWVSVRDRPGTAGVTPSSRASSPTSFLVRWKTPAESRPPASPRDPRHALPAAARYVAAGPLPRDYRCPYRYDRARRSVSTAWLPTRDLGDDGSASRCLRDAASRGEFDHAQRMGCSPGRITVHRILAVTSRRFQGFPTEALGVACVLPH